MIDNSGFPKIIAPTRIDYDTYKTTDVCLPIPKLYKPQKKDQGVKLVGQLSQVFQRSFIFGLLGRPGSGKTSVLSQLITRPQFYGKKFGRVLYITPSDIPGVEHDPRINTSRTLDFQWITRKLKQCEGRCRNVLLVIDDVISDMPPNQRSQIKNIFYDRRHILGPNSCLSIIVTSQKYTCIPRWLRTCMDMFLCFCVQPAQLRCMSLQLNTGKDIKALGAMFRGLQKHQFVFFNLQKGGAYNSQFKRI